MKKFTLFLLTMMVSFASAFADIPDYTSVSLSSTEINLDDETASIGLIVDGDLDEMNQMYAQFGMVSNMLNNAYLYEGNDAEGVKLDPVQVAWGKPLNFIEDMSTLKYDTTYKLVIEVGGLSTMSYMTMGDLFKNTEEITLTFKTLAGRTDPYVKSAKFNVQNYQTVDLDDQEFEGIKLAVEVKNLPTVGAYNVFMGGVRLYDLDNPETGKFSYCPVNATIDSKEFIICSKDKLAKGKNYKVEIPFESLYVHNMFDMSAEVCYFNVASVEFYTEYEAPTADIDATCKLYQDKVTITNANADQNTFVYILDNSYLNAGQTAEEFAIKQLNYSNESMLNKGTFDAPYNQFLWGMYEGEYSVVFMGAEYDATREACYATTKPKVVNFSVDENGNVIVANTPEVTLNSYGLSTFSAPVAVSIVGAKAYIAKVGGIDVLTCTLIEGDIPANTGVILKGEAGATVTIGEATVTAADVDGNVLSPSSDENTAGYDVYVLDGDTFKRWGNALVPNKAYIKFPSAPSAPIRIVFDDATAINGIAADAARNGKFIENGRVVIVKDGKKFNVAGLSVK